jgi:hypothetical protein
MATETTETLPPTGAAIAPNRRGVPRRRLGRMRETRYRTLVVSWFLATAAFLAFVGFGSLSIEAGSAEGRYQRIVGTWSRFANNLPRSGHQDLLRAAFFGALAVLVIGSSVGLWLAMRVDDAPADASPPSTSE